MTEISYAKFGRDDSGVYLFGGEMEDGTHIIVCCRCYLYPLGDETDPFSRPDVGLYSLDSTLGHIEEHRNAGHIVPDYAIEEIKTDGWLNQSGESS